MIAKLLIPMLGVLTMLGIAYTLAAAALVARLHRRRNEEAPAPPQAVTILKPLFGAEPRLVENLETFLRQDWDAPIQLLCGVHAASDPAFAAVEALKARYPEHDIACVVDDLRHGANAKVGNLINMLPAARHDILILSDSDMSAGPDYLRRVVAALDAPDVGAVTCLYRGRGDTGVWSVLGAAGLSYNFLPSVIVGLALDAGDVCMGSTIALRRATLDRIGGFTRFADRLADDHAIGGAVRDCGLAVVVPPMVITHASTDQSLLALFRHERRWAATVRQINPAGYAGMIVTFPLPFALALLAFAPWAGAVLLVMAVATRAMLIASVDRLCGARSAPLWLLPIRDILSLLVFFAGLVTGSVEWRGERLRMRDDGRIAADAEMTG
ncbi:bacteriohopanetetrol glucosamine biosynthesis glycosyltransferase HpnI [Rhizorhabdus argentea]|uniref:bacteriohopanetetrol glucosamine biosynthesis glycosyltransferase HpnI n=1 Tax=Rhizorhabdus argentea TaxID=1387174 RepID=UPI0030ED7D38